MLVLVPGGAPLTDPTQVEPCAPQVVATPRQGPAPLSFAQEHLWRLDRLEPGQALYNIPFSMRLDREVRPAVLAAALAEVVRRHEVLRTTFPASGGEPLQVVAPTADLPLPVIDLAALPPRRRQPEAQRQAAAEARRPFSLAHGPLLRTALLWLGGETQVLLATLHHIAGDAWSPAIFAREMAALCAAFAAGRPSPLAPLPVRYADYAMWQRRWLAGEALAHQLAFWRQQLTGAPPVAALPADRSRKAVRSHLGARCPVPLSRREVASLHALAAGSGSTLLMVLATGLAALLSRYGAGEDLVLGHAVANRDRIEIEPLIGCIANHLVLRTDLSGDPGFAALLRRVRQAALAAHAHRDLPFEKLVEELGVERGSSQTPLFQVLVTLQQEPLPETAPAGAAPRRWLAAAGDSGTARFDLTLAAHDLGAGGGTAFLEYATDLFDPPTVARLADHLARLLAGAAAEPLVAVSSLPLLAAAETHQLLAEWGDGGAAAVRASLYEMLAARAAAAPERPAVELGEQRLTYAELMARTHRLADRLRRCGVGPETVVAVCARWTPARLVGLLGVLAAGGAYLPLDPAEPDARLAWMLADSGATLAVAQRSLSPRLAALDPGLACLALDEMGGAAAPAPPAATTARPAVPPPPAADLPESLCYVIYTSGSSGRPKGVAVSRRAAAAHFETARRVWGVSAGDRVLQFASPGFDVALEQVFSALLAGATLVLRGEEPWTPGELWRRAAQLRLTHADLPTAYWREAAAADEPRDAAGGSLRRLLVGGEAMPVAAARRWSQGRQAGMPAVGLVNVYGPTEATVSATWFEVAGGAGDGPWVPIGRPLPGRQCFVLGGSMQPVAIGAVGELFLGGAAIARGYLGDPARTAAAFVPNPFAGRAGDRLYRTGDLVRHRPDGNLEFLGRVDRQLKVRGFRIEPGEIETALRRHPAVADAVVVARREEAAERDPRLVAYLVAAACRPAAAAGPAAGSAPAAGRPDMAAGPPSAAALRQYLRQRLPEHMLPAAYSWLARLPLTAAGKVDRRALSAPRAVE
jgi:amino acid adenylation domain-containing protein